MTRFYAVLVALLLTGTGQLANAGSHEFMLSCADGHRSFVRAKYGDIDPGREYARVSVGQKFAPFHGNSCQVVDFRGVDECPSCHWEEFTAANLSWDQADRLLRGDVTVVPEVVIGVPAKTIENVGKEAERVLKRIRLF